MRLFYHTITWGGDFKGALRDMAEGGYRGSEAFARTAEEHEGRADAFREVMAQHEMEFVTCYGGGVLLAPNEVRVEIDKHERYAMFLSQIGADLGKERVA